MNGDELTMNARHVDAVPSLVCVSAPEASATCRAGHSDRIRPQLHPPQRLALTVCEVPELVGRCPSLSAALLRRWRLVIFRSMTSLKVRTFVEFPFVHDLSADYTPGDIAFAAE